MKRITLSCALLVLLGAPMASASGPDAFSVIMDHYDPIRLALLQDSTQGVSENGASIAAELRALQADFTHERAGATHEASMAVKEALPEMIVAAENLAEADSLSTTRDAFSELTKFIVRWREGVTDDDRPVVAYCPMHKKAWLQPDGKIGNPYGGMPGCGQIVSK